MGSHDWPGGIPPVALQVRQLASVYSPVAGDYAYFRVPPGKHEPSGQSLGGIGIPLATALPVLPAGAVPAGRGPVAMGRLMSRSGLGDDPPVVAAAGVGGGTLLVVGLVALGIVLWAG